MPIGDDRRTLAKPISNGTNGIEKFVGEKNGASAQTRKRKKLCAALNRTRARLFGRLEGSAVNFPEQFVNVAADAISVRITERN